MNIEAVFYRLSILLILSSILGGGSLSIYSHLEANDWNELARSSYETMSKGSTDCESMKNSFACTLAPSRQEAFDTSIEMRNKFQERSNFWLNITYIGPLTIGFLFYSLRWAVTGKLRPLNVLSKK